MIRVLHPLILLTLAALPCVLYSVYRTGFEVWQFTRNPIFFQPGAVGFQYVMELVALVAIVVFCSFSYSRTGRPTFGILTLVTVAAFLILVGGGAVPRDYKLWIYIIAPILFWAAALSALVFGAASKLKGLTRRCSEPRAALRSHFP